jgi:hypothetical protein
VPKRLLVFCPFHTGRNRERYVLTFPYGLWEQPLQPYFVKVSHKTDLRFFVFKGGISDVTLLIPPVINNSTFRRVVGGAESLYSVRLRRKISTLGALWAVAFQKSPLLTKSLTRNDSTSLR